MKRCIHPGDLVLMCDPRDIEGPGWIREYDRVLLRDMSVGVVVSVDKKVTYVLWSGPCKANDRLMGFFTSKHQLMKL